jgi:pantoate--beta-alanine ligase
MEIVREVPALRVRLAESRSENAGVVLVPTMGALHAGHLSLTRRALELGRPVVVSIFVNPTQFGPGEDFRRYPRPFEVDVDAARRSGVDLLFAPAVETVYPAGERIEPPPLPAVATDPGLEDAARPGHFQGVCQVVARLFDLVRPAAAVFGEKDYQQLLVIAEMVRAMSLDEPWRWGALRIEACPTVREPDGLAMSSRNTYLSPRGRASALGLSRALASACDAGEPDEAEKIMARVLENHRLDIEYAVVRDTRTLGLVDSLAGPTRALIAARCEGVRLIDNRALPVRG